MESVFLSRAVDPAELLIDLGFGGSPASTFSRIPTRFFATKSHVSDLYYWLHYWLQLTFKSLVVTSKSQLVNHSLDCRQRFPNLMFNKKLHSLFLPIFVGGNRPWRTPAMKNRKIEKKFPRFKLMKISVFRIILRAAETDTDTDVATDVASSIVANPRLIILMVWFFSYVLNQYEIELRATSYCKS